LRQLSGVEVFNPDSQHGAFFQRLVNKIYGGLKGVSLQAYLDDVVIGSCTPREHIEDIREMLRRTMGANLRIKFSKCAFGRREVEVLGHKVAKGQVKPSDRHRDCMRDFVEPTNVTELLRFPGVLQYFGSHMDHLADMAAPLYEVLKGTHWNAKKQRRKVRRLEDWADRWRESQREAFFKLRDLLADPAFLVPARQGTRKRLCVV
jgi:hypothetical protein